MNSASTTTALGTDFQFLRNDAGESEGLNDAGIETYKNNPNSSLARECGQNSNDAGTKRPVIVNFDLLEVPTPSIPGIDNLRAAVRACLAEASQRQDEKAVDFFSRAERVLAASIIKIMRVADENTKGLIGPCVPGTPFHALLKSTGESNKDRATSGGSFGIGKNAAFAVSDLRTVFYSTMYRDPNNGTQKFLAQGKAKLTSHSNADGKPMRAVGYWGKTAGFNPVEDTNDVPDWLRRANIGTSVFALGFRDSPDWPYRIAYSLLVNFFASIHRGEMQFGINNGAITIDANSIAGLFGNHKVREAAIADEGDEDFEFARTQLLCLTSPETVETKVTIPGLGEISIRVLVQELLAKRVAIIRNGMVITDSLVHFGDRFNRFPLYRDFVAIVEPLEIVGSTLLKKLESPSHDELSAERIPDPDKMAAARKSMIALAKKIRETIRMQTKIEHQDELTIDELSEFFADQAPNDRPPEPSDELDPERLRYQPQPAPKRAVVGRKSATGGGSGYKGKRTKGGDGTGSGGGTGSGSGGPGAAIDGTHIPLREVRTTPSQDQLPEKRQVRFTPMKSGDAIVTLEAAGLNENEKLAIVSADQGTVINGGLKINLTEDSRMSVCVEFSEPFVGPIEISATIAD